MDSNTPGLWVWKGNYLYASDGTEILYYTIDDDGIHCENSATLRWQDVAAVIS